MSLSDTDYYNISIYENTTPTYTAKKYNRHKYTIQSKNMLPGTANDAFSAS